MTTETLSDPTTRVASTSRRTRGWAEQVVRQDNFWIVVVLALLVVVFSIVSVPGTFLSTANVRSLALDSAATLLLACGMTYLLLSGNIDLSIGSVTVFNAVVASKVMIAIAGPGTVAPTHVGVAIAAGVAASLVSGICWGLVNGFVVVRLKVPAFIATLGTMGVALGLAQVVTDGVNVTGLPLSLQVDFGLASLGGVPYPVLTAIALFAILWVVLASTRYGVRTYAIGSNPEAARRAGIPVDRHTVSVYVLMGLLTGAVAVLDIARFGTASLSAHSQDILTVIAAVVIGGASLYGGRGRMSGTLVGVLIPMVLLNGFVIIGVEAFWQNVSIGVVLIAAVYLDQLRRRKRAGK